MSAVRGFEVPNSQASGSSIEVPRSFQPDNDTVLISSDSKYLEFPASATTFAPSGTSQIIIPQANARYILGGSMYLNFNVLISASATIAAEIAAGSGRSGLMTYFTGGPTKSAAALIDRITITAANGQVLSDITNYAQYHNLILLHAANDNYIKTASISESAFTQTTTSSATNATAAVGTATTISQTNLPVTVNLPLALGLFNEVKAFPLWAVNGPLIVLIQWASSARSLGVGLSLSRNLIVSSGGFNTDNGFAYQPSPAMTNVTSSWTGRELSIRARCVDVDIDYINQQKAQMAMGKVLTFNYKQVQNLITPSGAASINFGVNCSSLLSVFGCNLMNDAADPVSSSSITPSVASVGSWGFNSNGMQNIRVYRDGQPLSTFPLLKGGNDDAFIPLMEAMGQLFSTSGGSMSRRLTHNGEMDNAVAEGNYSSSYYQHSLANHFSFTKNLNFDQAPIWVYKPAYLSGSVYTPNTYAWGLSARSCNDTEVANKGSRCSQLQLTVDSGSSTAGIHYIYYLYSCSVSFDATGNVIVRR